jgi:hypothetical protein
VPSNWRAAFMVAAACVSALLPRAASAQSEDRWSFDSAVGIRQWVGEGASHRPDVVVDFTAAARLGNGWTAYVRPWFRKSSSSPYDLAKEIYQAAVQHEQSGRVATRLELGYILSPIGIGMMDMRPDANPTISSHMSYLIAMPRFDRDVPGSMPIASSYPLGSQFTASTTTWDVRAAVLTSPPNRQYVVGNSDGNPAARPVLVVGGGLTPQTGVRLGMAYATGAYVRRDELPSAAASARHSRLVTIEGDVAVNYTHINGEFAFNRIDVATGVVSASSWFVQGQQTLSPRWFLAGRLEGANAPPSLTGIAHPILRINEATAGFRASPEVTIRTAFATRRTYFSTVTNHQVGVSLVWARRWR